jgi:hypothetical protein
MNFEDDFVTRILNSEHSLGVRLLRVSSLIVNIASPASGASPTITGNQNVVCGTSVSDSVDRSLSSVLPITKNPLFSIESVKNLNGTTYLFGMS